MDDEEWTMKKLGIRRLDATSSHLVIKSLVSYLANMLFFRRYTTFVKGMQLQWLNQEHYDATICRYFFTAFILWN
jgi:hypothetical protein